MKTTLNKKIEIVLSVYTYKTMARDIEEITLEMASDMHFNENGNSFELVLNEQISKTVKILKTQSTGTVTFLVCKKRNEKEVKYHITNMSLLRPILNQIIKWFLDQNVSYLSNTEMNKLTFRHWINDQESLFTVTNNFHARDLQFISRFETVMGSVVDMACMVSDINFKAEL
jgi:hypothetical protein